jgi:hypothetical protein
MPYARHNSFVGTGKIFLALLGKFPQRSIAIPCNFLVVITMENSLTNLGFSQEKTERNNDL